MKPTDLVVPKTFSIEDVVAAIYDRAKGKQISRLTVICHGVGVMVYGDMETDSKKTVVLPGSSKSHPSAAVCKIYGGYGLNLGKGTLSITNAPTFGQLKGWFSDGAVFEICGCAAADTGPAVGTLTGDGPALMRALAAATGAAVRAPIRLQTVNQNWYLGTADRTAFAGPTFLFMPDGRQITETTCN
jgi:hypothetical protein